MNLRLLMVCALCCAFLLTTSASASDGWFGSSKKPAANGVTSTGTKKSWWPTWTTKSTSKPKAKSSGKSMWSTVSTGTKNTWNKTTSFLNPFDNPPKADASKAPPANSSGWFTPKTEKKTVETVPDFLVTERPKWVARKRRAVLFSPWP